MDEGFVLLFRQQLHVLFEFCGSVELVPSSLLPRRRYFDHSGRRKLLTEWRSALDIVGVKFKRDVSLIEYLSTASERLAWKGCSLPVDDLCTENAIIMSRFNRYPLIIDPSGQVRYCACVSLWSFVTVITFALLHSRICPSSVMSSLCLLTWCPWFEQAAEFISRHLSSKHKKVQMASFQDSSFLKSLESALRFGTALVVQDVEGTIDPVLFPVLNREFAKVCP